MKTILPATLIAILLIWGAVVLSKNQNQNTNPTQPVNNVTVVDGKQIIEIEAKGGYQPRVSTAQANIPTIIRFKTNGNFDCSSSVRIPSMKILKNLPSSGTTDIDIGSQSVSTFKGSCGMGMYPFEIEFK